MFRRRILRLLQLPCGRACGSISLAAGSTCIASLVSKGRGSVHLEEKADVPARIILIRHGQSVANVDPLEYERNPDSQIHLTKKGWRQAEDAGRLLQKMSLGRVRVFYSPFVRAQETLHGLELGYAQSLDTSTDGAVEDIRLRELSPADLGNHSEEQFMKNLNTHFVRDPYFYAFGATDSLALLEHRVRDFIIELFFTKMSDTQGVETVILVSHAATILCLLKVLIGGKCDNVSVAKSTANCEVLVLERKSVDGDLRYYIASSRSVDEHGNAIVQNFDSARSIDDQWAIVSNQNRNFVGMSPDKLKNSLFKESVHRSPSEAQV